MNYFQPRQFNPTPSAHPSSSAPSLQSSAGTSQSSTPCTPGPIRFTINKQSQGSPTNTPRASYSKTRFLRERDHMTSSIKTKNMAGKGQSEHDMTLDKIVTEYLRKQHALCRKPVSTCPSMSLFS